MADHPDGFSVASGLTDLRGEPEPRDPTGVSRSPDYRYSEAPLRYVPPTAPPAPGQPTVAELLAGIVSTLFDAETILSMVRGVPMQAVPGGGSEPTVEGATALVAELASQIREDCADIRRRLGTL